MASRTPSRSVSSADLAQRQGSPNTELSLAEKEKRTLVEEACKDCDTDALVEFATSVYGLVSDEVRKTAWPLLLASSGYNQEGSCWKDLPEHKDEHQVSLDVNRAFVYYPTNESQKQLERRKEDLSNVIVDVLRHHPRLCYFQGYHDIVQVLLLVLGPQDAPAAVARLSLLRIRDFMLSTLDPALAQLELLRPIIRAADPELYTHLPKSQPSFALANTITMFAHNIHAYKDITRLFDFFLARHAVMPLYLFAAVVVSKRDELLNIEEDEEDIMYVMLGKLPQPFHVEFHIARTLELYEMFPPASLRSWEWWRISSSSVLKASATSASLRSQTLDEGERYLEQQEKEFKRQHSFRHALKNVKYVRTQLWRYRQHSALGFAVLFGAYAIWLGRYGDLASSTYAGLFAVNEFVRRLFGSGL